MLDAQLDRTMNDGTDNRKDAARRDIRKFVTTNFYVADALALSDDASLLDGGVIDSTGVLEVISYLESEFGIQVADEEIVPENLDSIARIAAYVARKRG